MVQLITIGFHSKCPKFKIMGFSVLTAFTKGTLCIRDVRLGQSTMTILVILVNCLQSGISQSVGIAEHIRITEWLLKGTFGNLLLTC